MAGRKLWLFGKSHHRKSAPPENRTTANYGWSEIMAVRKIAPPEKRTTGKSHHRVGNYGWSEIMAVRKIAPPRKSAPPENRTTANYGWSEIIWLVGNYGCSENRTTGKAHHRKKIAPPEIMAGRKYMAVRKSAPPENRSTGKAHHRKIAPPQTMAGRKLWLFGKSHHRKSAPPENRTTANYGWSEIIWLVGNYGCSENRTTGKAHHRKKIAPPQTMAGRMAGRNFWLFGKSHHRKSAPPEKRTTGKSHHRKLWLVGNYGCSENRTTGKAHHRKIAPPRRKLWLVGNYGCSEPGATSKATAKARSGYGLCFSTSMCKTCRSNNKFRHQAPTPENQPRFRQPRFPHRHFRFSGGSIFISGGAIFRWFPRFRPGPPPISSL